MFPVFNEDEFDAVRACQKHSSHRIEVVKLRRVVKLLFIINMSN